MLIMAFIMIPTIRTTVCEQLLPEIEKAQSVAPQTIKYRYRTVISDQWIH